MTRGGVNATPNSKLKAVSHNTEIRDPTDYDNAMKLRNTRNTLTSLAIVPEPEEPTTTAAGPLVVVSSYRFVSPTLISH